MDHCPTHGPAVLVSGVKSVEISQGAPRYGDGTAEVFRTPRPVPLPCT